MARRSSTVTDALVADPVPPLVAVCGENYVRRLDANQTHLAEADAVIACPDVFHRPGCILSPTVYWPSPSPLVSRITAIATKATMSTEATMSRTTPILLGPDVLAVPALMVANPPPHGS